MTTADMTSEGATTPTHGAARWAARAASALFLAAIAALPFMQPFTLKAMGSAVQVADALFALSGAAWLASLALGGAALRRGRFHALLGAFLGAALLTTAAAPARSAGRLAIEVYLIGLSVLAYHLVRSLADLRRTWAVWTGTALFTTACILVSALLFYTAGITDSKKNLLLWTAGSLPVGNYPRVRGFFLNGNMTGNYLAMSACLAAGLAAISERHRRWALPAGFAIGTAALFTLSTALGGLAIAAAIFAWLLQRDLGKARYLKALSPLSALFAAVLLFYTAFYPKKQASGLVLEPSPRWLTWASSWKTFLTHPLIGNGLGVPLADVHYDPPRGVHEHLTDPHNAWLSLAGQMGLVGLCAFVALLAWMLRGLRGMALVGDPVKAARAALLGALVVVLYQAMSCSLEDMRHVWILFGITASIVEGQEGDAAVAA